MTASVRQHRTELVPTQGQHRRWLCRRSAQPTYRHGEFCQYSLTHALDCLTTARTCIAAGSQATSRSIQSCVISSSCTDGPATTELVSNGDTDLARLKGSNAPSLSRCTRSPVNMDQRLRQARRTQAAFWRRAKKLSNFTSVNITTVPHSQRGNANKEPAKAAECPLVLPIRSVEVLSHASAQRASTQDRKRAGRSTSAFPCDSPAACTACFTFFVDARP